MKSPRVEEQKGFRILGIFMLILNDLRKAFASFYTIRLNMWLGVRVKS